MKKILVAGLLFLAACATSKHSYTGTIHVSAETWGHFQNYLATIGSNRPGAFAIQKTGDGSFYIYCSDLQCMGGPTYKAEALRKCEQNGGECVIFAYGRDILVSYDVAKPQASYSSGSSSQSASATPTDTRSIQRISQAFRTEVDDFVAGSKTSSGRYRFLAVSPKGDRIGTSTTCKIQKAGWGGWTAEGCGGEAQARQRAVQSCGTDCRVIYDGETLDPAIKLEWF